MSAADFAAGRLRQKQNLFQRLSELADFDAKPAPMADDAERVLQTDILQPDEKRKRERFIPVTRFALLDRLTRPFLWNPGQAAEARRFFRYLDYWRQQQYFALLLDLEQTYETFSPDSDLLMTRSFSEDERASLKHRVFEGVESLLQRANYERIDPTDVEMILTRDSHYGLDLTVDMKAFEHIVIYYRGASNQKYERRSIRKYLRKEEFNVPIFQRLFLMFKLKPFEMRVEEAMRENKLSREAAEKWVTKRCQHLPPSINERNIYLKLFKNIPRIGRRDGISEHGSAVSPAGQTPAWRHGQRRARHGCRRRCRQDRAFDDESDCGGRSFGGSRRHPRPPGHGLL